MMRRDLYPHISVCGGRSAQRSCVHAHYLESRIESLAAELVADLPGRDSLESVDEVATIVARRTLCILPVVPNGEMSCVFGWTTSLVRPLDPEFSAVPAATKQAVDEVEVDGSNIFAGEQGKLYDAANTDPAVFEAPRRLSATQVSTKRFLSFGIACTHCPGARVAALQLNIIPRALLAAILDIHAVSEPDFLRSNLVVGTKRLQFGLSS